MKKSLLLCIASVLAVCSVSCSDSSNDCDVTASDCAKQGQRLDADKCECVTTQVPCDTAAKLAECSAQNMDLDTLNCTCKSKSSCDINAKTLECAALGQTFDNETCSCKTTPAECDIDAKTQECAAKGQMLDETSCECKTIPAECDINAKTQECAAKGQMLDETSCECKTIPVGCDADSKKAECEAAGKDFDIDNCDCKEKSSTDFKVNEVPSSQNNKENAACNAETFVEHCNGDKIVYCLEGKVAFYDCTELNDTYEGQKYEYTCGITLMDGFNYSECVGKTDEDLCEDESREESFDNCEYDDYGYEYESTYLCKQFNDGKNHIIWVDGQYCSNLCEDGCKQIKCNEDGNQACSTDKKYTQECYEMSDGATIVLAYNCSYDQEACYINDEGNADCQSAGGDDTCDPQTYPGTCSEDQKTGYYCSTEGKLTPKPCDGNKICAVKSKNSVACEAPECTKTAAECEAQDMILDNQACVCVGDCVKGGSSYCKKTCSADKSEGYYYSGGEVKVQSCPNKDCVIKDDRVACGSTSTETCSLTAKECEDQNMILDNQACVCVGDCVKGGTSYCKKTCSADKSEGYYYSGGEVKVLSCPNRDCAIQNDKVVCDSTSTETCTKTAKECEDQGMILDTKACECVGDCVKGGSSYCKKACSADKSEGYYYSGGEVKVQSCPNKDCAIKNDKVVCDSTSTETCTKTAKECEDQDMILDTKACECVGNCVKGGTSYCKKNCSDDKSEGYYYSGGEVKVQSCPNRDCYISSDNKIECGQVNTNPNPGNDDRTKDANCDKTSYYGACSDDLTKRYYCNDAGKVVEKDCPNGCDLATLNGNNSSQCKN